MVNNSLPERIFLDTSFLKGLFDPRDDFHLQARLIWERLEKAKPLIITSNYIIDETFTLLRKRCGMDIVRQVRKDLVITKRVRIIRATVVDEAEAWQWLQKNWSDLSFTDCVSFAQMKRLGITRVTTFDGHFSRAGFQIETGSS